MAAIGDVSGLSCNAGDSSEIGVISFLPDLSDLLSLNIAPRVSTTELSVHGGNRCHLVCPQLTHQAPETSFPVAGLSALVFTRIVVAVFRLRSRVHECIQTTDGPLMSDCWQFEMSLQPLKLGSLLLFVRAIQVFNALSCGSPASQVLRCRGLLPCPCKVTIAVCSASVSFSPSVACNQRLLERKPSGYQRDTDPCQYHLRLFGQLPEPFSCVAVNRGETSDGLHTAPTAVRVHSSNLAIVSCRGTNVAAELCKSWKVH
jgi:hypothetical protein